MLNGIRVRIFWEAVNAALDTPLQASQSYSVWLGKLNESLSEFGDEHPCWPVINVIETMGPGLLSSPTPAWTEANDWEEMERGHGSRRCTKCEILAGSRISWEDLVW